jgi:hypothetical protein
MSPNAVDGAKQELAEIDATYVAEIAILNMESDDPRRWFIVLKNGHTRVGVRLLLWLTLFAAIYV